MGLNKPYYRIARPKSYIPAYVKDTRYASDRIQLSRAYINIENELRKVFDYIEPDENNKNTFSFELYSILLRACTEVELNCKLIMEANGASPIGKHFTMTDYVKLEQSSKLSKYKVLFNNWRNKDSSKKLIYEKKEIYPFKNFDPQISQSPQWYKDYNSAKHNRELNLDKANLDNCISAVAGILVLLYSQFGSCCIETYTMGGLHIQYDDAYDNAFDANVIFDIYPPEIDDWPIEEQYDFDWNTIKNTDTPFEKFIFQ